MTTSTLGRKNKELLVIVLLLNLAAVGWYGFLFREIKMKNEVSSNLVNDIDARVAEENMQSSIKALAAETTVLREKLTGYSVAREGAVSFIELLETAGKNTGASVSIESVSTANVPDSTALETLRLTLNATGSWRAVIRFLGLLEFLPYEARIEQVVVSKPPQGGEPWRINLALYVLKEK